MLDAKQLVEAMTTVTTDCADLLSAPKSGVEVIAHYPEGDEMPYSVEKVVLEENQWVIYLGDNAKWNESKDRKEV